MQKEIIVNSLKDTEKLAKELSNKLIVEIVFCFMAILEQERRLLQNIF